MLSKSFAYVKNCQPQKLVSRGIVEANGMLVIKLAITLFSFFFLNTMAFAAGVRGCEPSLSSRLSVEVHGEIGREWVDDTKNAKPGSYLARLKINIEEIAPDQYLLSMPKVSEMNRIFGFKEGQSAMIFQEYRAGGTVPKSLYDEKLSQGIVLIAKYKGLKENDLYVHDVISHAMGYVMLSKTPSWPKILAAMTEMTTILNSKSLPDRIKSIAKKERNKMGLSLDETTGMLTVHDADDPNGMADFIKTCSDNLITEVQIWNELKKSLAL
jgi:hypothetical protein